VALSQLGGAIRTLRVHPGSTLDTRQAATIQLGNIPPQHGNDENARLELRGAVMAGGLLAASNILINCTYRNATGSYIALDTSTVVNAIAVSNQLVIGTGSYGGLSYVGDPAAAGYRLPPGVSIRVGVSPSQRGLLQIGRNSGLGDGNQSQTAVLAASTGGVFEAYLTSLKVVPYETNYSATMSVAQNGTLDLAGMSSCTVDVVSLVVAPNYSTNANANPRGTVKLPPGTVTAGTVEIGATNGLGFGLLTLSNTTVTVTNSITINKTGQIQVNVTTQSCGIVVNNAADTALNMDTATNGALRIVFHGPPTTRPFYGFSWVGDHVGALQGLQAAGKLVTDNSGMAPRPVEIFKSGGFTYVGVPLPSGSSFMFR
jgi:hypothetical protein